MNNRIDKNLPPKGPAADALFKAAAAKLGCSPEQLKARIESGTLEKSLRSSADPRLRAAADALSDPKTAERLRNDPNAQALMKKFGGK